MKYIQFNRDSDVTIHKYPLAFNLLAVIARRAKRTEHFDNKNLVMGEALIGDYKNYGLTRQQYRTCLNFLKSTNQITYRTTNKGTIVKLISTSIFNINEDQPTNGITNESTIEQPTGNHQTTTNNNDKNENKDFSSKKLVNPSLSEYVDFDKVFAKREVAA